MRVLAISHNWPHKDDPSCGIFMTRQMIGLRDLGADVTVLVPLAYAPNLINRFERYKLFRPRKLIKYEGITSLVFRFFRLPGMWAMRWDGFSCYLSMKRWVKAAHAQKPFDVIYSRCLIPEGDIGIRLSRLLNIPVLGVGIGHDVNVIPLCSSILNRHFVWVTRNLNCLMATGQQVADEMEKSSGEKVIVLSGVVDLQKFCPASQKNKIRGKLGLPNDAIVILFVGHLERNKGIFELVDAFKNIKKVTSNLILIVCGEGIHGEAFKEYVHDSGVAESIKLLGVVNPEEIPAWMQASDIFVLPTYHEGMPNAVMEAMACGLPVISTLVGGLPAAVGDCEGVLLAHPKNTNELQSAMVKIINSQELRLQMSQASRERAERCFGLEANTGRLLKCIEKTIENYNLTKCHDRRLK